MKTNPIKFLLPVALFLALAFITGCATAPPVDWGSRVGHYTYAQAVNELGPPNRQVRHSNGTTEFRWFLQPATSGTSLGVGGMNNPGMNNNGINGMNNGPALGQSTSPGFSNRYLQLTFDSNGVLTAWSKNY